MSVYKPDSIRKVALPYTEDIKYFGYSFDGVNRKIVKDGLFIDA